MSHHRLIAIDLKTQLLEGVPRGNGVEVQHIDARDVRERLLDRVIDSLDLHRVMPNGTQVNAAQLSNHFITIHADTPITNPNFDADDLDDAFRFHNNNITTNNNNSQA